MARFMRNQRERKKERGGEEKKKRNAIAIIIPFDRRDIGEIIQSCYFVRERRIVASTTSIGGPKIPQMLENRVERRWKKGEVWEGMGKKKRMKIGRESIAIDDI